MTTPARPTIFFLSDYGLADEFVGVVHAVLLRLAPDAAVVDLTHGVPAFDVRAGAEALVRAVPHLGPGVVLAVVDPGVGGSRRGVAVRSGDGRWFVAPDNGLVVPAAEAGGGVTAVHELAKPEDAPATFDGRDVFAPAAAALAVGNVGDLGDLGAVRGEAGDPGWPRRLGGEVDPASLVRLPALEVTRADEGGRRFLRAPVTWVDRFGNVQLGAPERDGPPVGAGSAGSGSAGGGSVGGGSAGGGSAGGGSVGVRVVERGSAVGGPVRARRPDTTPLRARRVRAFSDLDPGELGVLGDANGRLAIVVREGSAASATQLVAGGVVELVW